MKQLPRRAIWFMFIGYLVVPVTLCLALALLAFVFVFGESSQAADFSAAQRYLGPIALAIVAVGGVSTLAIYLYVLLDYRYYRYELNDVGLHTERGILNKRYVTIPYVRVQNVDIYRSFLMRLMGLSTVRVQTAGNGASSGPEGRLVGVTVEEGEEIRRTLTSRMAPAAGAR